MNYEQAKIMYETTRKRKLVNNTYLVKNLDGSYAVVLHGNQIIRFYPDKTILSSCGWYTVTTKDRLNKFTEFNVWQRDFVWYIGKYCEPGCEKNAVTAAMLFKDGITYQNGKFS